MAIGRQDSMTLRLVVADSYVIGRLHRGARVTVNQRLVHVEGAMEAATPIAVITPARTARTPIRQAPWASVAVACSSSYERRARHEERRNAPLPSMPRLWIETPVLALRGAM